MGTVNELQVEAVAPDVLLADRVQALAITDPSLFQLNCDTHEVLLEQPGMRIDLGALAKGWIADRIVDLQQGAAAGPGLEGIVITNDLQMAVTSGLRGRVELAE